MAIQSRKVALKADCFLRIDLHKRSKVNDRTYARSQRGGLKSVKGLDRGLGNPPKRIRMRRRIS